MNEKISKTFAFFDESARNKKREKFIFLEEENSAILTRLCHDEIHRVASSRIFCMRNWSTQFNFCIFIRAAETGAIFLSFLFKKASRN